MSIEALTPIPVESVKRIAYTRGELAESIQASERWIWEQTKNGTIPHVVIGGRTFYPVAAIEKWFSEQAGGAEK